MITLLASTLMMSTKATDATLNWFERIVFKWNMSIYSGWVSTATIVSSAITLKLTGVATEWNETTWSVIMLWVATVIYGVHSFLNEDPIYGSILIWSGSAIKQETDNATITTNLTAIIYLMGVYVLALPSVPYFMD